MGNICQEFQIQKLEIISSFDQGLQKNMSNHIQQLPDKRYAIRVYDCPKLSEKSLKILEEELQRQNFAEEGRKGVQFPPFMIHRRQLYYQGQWKDRMPNGKGKIYFPQGHYFEGYFNEGEANSTNGILIFSDGSYYRGQVQNSQLLGKGKFISSSGMSYEGNWVNNKPQGMGKQIFSDGNTYQGQFVNGLKQGKGIFKWKDGKIYEGLFARGKMNGKGKLYRGDGQIYQGDFQDNKKVGNGKLQTAYGIYEGHFQNGLFSGQGRFVWKNKNIYEGTFKQGKMDGEGILTFPSGQTFKGIWQMGQNTKLTQLKLSNNKRS